MPAFPRANPELTPLLTGEPPAGFELLRPVAVKRFAETWKVCAKHSGEPFAWKRLRPEFANDPEARRQLRREARAAGAVAGKFVIRLADERPDESPPWLLLEWLDGETLQQRLEVDGKLPAGTAFWIARQTAQGLLELQQAGFFHGDLRPESLCVLSTGAVKLVNLSFASPLGENQHGGERIVDRRTAEYLAPEFGCDPLHDRVAADVYALGAVLFRMLAGRPPFTGEVAADVLRLHRQAKPPSIAASCPGLPAAGVALVEALLRKQPLRRPRPLPELVRALMDLELQTLTLRRAG